MHPYEDPLVIAGQGTVGLELLEQVDGLDAIVVPVGGGGLIAGIAVAAHGARESAGGLRRRVAQLPLDAPAPGGRAGGRSAARRSPTASP